MVEDCIVIWLLDGATTNVENETCKLRRIVSTVQVFVDVDQCLVRINNVRMEKIFLIVSTVQPHLNSIRDLSQVEKIYVLDSSSPKVPKDVDSDESLDTFDDIDRLCEQLELDVELCGLDLLLITASRAHSHDGNASIAEKQQEAAFLFSQLLKEILYRLKFDNNAKKEFVHFCRLHYADNSEQLQMINDFEANYRPQKALYWLTRQCFVWRLLQRMPRTFEIDILYKLGFLIKHASTQMTILQENHPNSTGHVLTVYRGKTMASDSFNTLIKTNAGGLLTFGNFFVAHMDRDVGIDFIRRRLDMRHDATAVLFEIHVKQTMHNARSAWAMLEQIRGDETIERNGIFFGIMSVFRLDSVDQFIDEQMNLIWSVRLTLAADDDPQLLRLVAPLRSSEVHANPISYMGKLFMEMGEYARAEQFFLDMLQDTSVRSEPRRLVRVHIGLGANCMSTGEFEKASHHYQQALDVSLSYLPARHTDLAPIYDAIGKSCFQQGQYQKAVDNFELAADLASSNTQPGQDQLVHELNTRISSAKQKLGKQP